MRWGRLAVENHRGILVPRVLGPLLAAAGLAWTVLYDLAQELGPAGWTSLFGGVLVSTAGLVDDLAPPGPRGLRGHLRSLAAGRVTTGVLKVVVTVGAAVVVIARLRFETGWEAVAAVVLLAACANAWNGLDVRPGRALKAFLPVGLAFVLAGDVASAPIVLGTFIGALVVLPLDLRELAMLGDAGSNLVGFMAGLGLVLILPGWGLMVAALIALALNLVAETVTFSQVIARIRPLRWLDELGRHPSA